MLGPPRGLLRRRVALRAPRRARGVVRAGNGLRPVFAVHPEQLPVRVQVPHLLILVGRRTAGFWCGKGSVKSTPTRPIIRGSGMRTSSRTGVGRRTQKMLSLNADR